MYHLFSGNTYYPAGGCDDYDGSYPTIEEARVAATVAIGRGHDWWHIVTQDESGRLVEVGSSAHH